MFKPTTRLLRSPNGLRRMALTTKQTNKGFYKGTGSGSMGWHTKHGGFRLDYSKVRTYVVPKDLDSFELTPFVTKRMAKTKGHFEGFEKGPLDGRLYLERWKSENGVD